MKIDSFVLFLLNVLRCQKHIRDTKIDAIGPENILFAGIIEILQAGAAKGLK